jgi:hypothetical protein
VPVQTETANDTFFAGCSGAGYSFPFEMPNFQQYAQRVGRLTDWIGPDSVDVWDWNIPLGPALFEEYSQWAGTSVQVREQWEQS